MRFPVFDSSIRKPKLTESKTSNFKHQKQKSQKFDRHI